MMLAINDFPEPIPPVMPIFFIEAKINEIVV
jgi:hypothetical protein